jgi:hypothetical protein
MATTQIVKVQVEAMSKYGYKANGKYVGLSKQLSDADKARLVPGASFDAEYYVADSGKEYLNKIVSMNTPKPVTDMNPPIDTERAVKNTPKAFKPSFTKKAEATSAGLSKEEWKMKDQRISRQGVIQAAVIALAPVVSLEQLPEEAIKLAETMLIFVNPGA